MTALATLYFSVEHTPSGIGSQLDVFPIFSKDQVEVAALILTKKF